MIGIIAVHISLSRMHGRKGRRVERGKKKEKMRKKKTEGKGKGGRQVSVLEGKMNSRGEM